MEFQTPQYENASASLTSEDRILLKKISDWRIGIDSFMRIYIQYIDNSGWLVKTERIPPAKIVDKLHAIVGYVDENDVKPLVGSEKLAVMKVVMGS